MDSLSIFSLIINAGFVVQVVMFILVLMSIYSWTLILSKKKILIDAKKDISDFHRHFLADTDLDKLHNQIPKLLLIVHQWSIFLVQAMVSLFTHSQPPIKH